MRTDLPLDAPLLRAGVEDVMRSLGRSPVLSPAPAPSAPPPVVARSSPPRASSKGSRHGVFEDVNEACAAAQIAFEQLREKGVAGRAKVVEIVKEMVTARAAEWGKFEF